MKYALGFFVCVYLCACSPKAQQQATKPLSDSALYELVQRQTIKYFMEGAEPISGAARERIHIDGVYPQQDADVVTSGGTGFGIMAILVGIERKFYTRHQGYNQVEKIVSFLERADNFHGAWPHWWYGPTGKVKPFSKKDDGGDLVETSFLLQGLLCARQYFKDGNADEQKLAARIDKLWRAVDFNWYRRGDQNVLYWHWSPQYGWDMNFAVRGYNECLIMYVLAAASPTHSVPASVYHEGWAEGGAIRKITAYEGDTLRLRFQGDPPQGAALFWAQYSYLGLNPTGLQDAYARYDSLNMAQARINYKWCVNNPKNFVGYSPQNWGLTASYSVDGYSAHAPNMREDLGVITPTAALASFPYTPAESMAAMRYWYNERQDKLWGPYGFYDAFSDTRKWYPQRYLAIDQGPIPVMMENHRSGLLWNLFMSCPEVQEGLKKLGFRVEK